MPDDPSFDVPQDWNELWSLVGEGLLGGIHHGLNNRVAALSAISQVLGIGMPDAGPLVASLEGEVDRLEEAVALLSLLRRARSRHPEPIQLPELTASLLPLLQQHAELKEIHIEVPSDPALMPAWAERDLLTRILLAVMLAAGLEAERRGDSRVVVEYGTDGKMVTLRVEVAAGGGVARQRGLIGPPRGLHAGAAAAAMEELGGDLQIGAGNDPPVRYTVRLPGLLAMRDEALGSFS